MIVLDTNVLAEPLRLSPALKCISWLNEQAAETLYITTITYAELWAGILRLPEGKRKKELATRIASVLDLFKQRTLSFDVSAAQQLGPIVARTLKAGRAAQAPDAYIAACAAAHGFAIATRNTKHFEHAGVAVVNPWQ